ncbi:MAG: hypothetical protein LBQ75_05285 [Zoogloeaceae bacterium]|jgi:hypothetical protein|nr:hypothetical protein [Zoogloeaceae bacterium]
MDPNDSGITRCYLACDFFDGRLVVPDHFTHWADAYIAAVSGGQVQFIRDEEGKMAARYPNGELFMENFSVALDDNYAKSLICRAIHLEHSIKEQFIRFGYIPLVVDSEGYAVCERSLHRILDAAIFGRKAGFLLRDYDESRLYGSLLHEQHVESTEKEE